MDRKTLHQCEEEEEAWKNENAIGRQRRDGQEKGIHSIRL
jgi:hypothetical protein